MNIKMRSRMSMAIVAAIIIAGLTTSCRTTEANYKAAYQKAVEKRDGITPLDSTIYGKYRKNAKQQYAYAGNDTVALRAIRVLPVSSEGTPREWLKRYSVVVGGFKQLFNARSLRDRFKDSGYPRTFIVQDAEPYYYVVADSYNEIDTAITQTNKLRTASPLPIKDPAPYILKSISHQ